MEVHSIESCKIYDDRAAVICSTAEDERQPIPIKCQMKHSEAFLIKKTGKNSWRRMTPEEASLTQKVIATSLWTVAGAGVGYLTFGPVGAGIGAGIGLKLGLKFGGVGRQVPVMIMAKKKMYVGALPLWQVKKLTVMIESPSTNIEFKPAEVN